MEENIGEKKTNKTGLIILIVVIVLAVGCGAFFLGKYFGDKKPAEPPKENETTKPAEIPDELKNATLIDIKVEKVNSEKTYEIQLAKKENKDYDSQTDEDKYIYAFYDKTNNKLLTDFTYKNITCSYSSETCINNPTETGCIEKGVTIYTFRVNNEDYILGTYYANYCGGNEPIHFIYNLDKNEIVEEGIGASKLFKSSEGDIIIEWSLAGDEICFGWQVGEICSNGKGYLFTDDLEFEPTIGLDAFKYDNNYAVVTANKGDIEIKIYNSKGKVVNTINNCVSYNQKYAVIKENNKLVLYDLNKNKIVESETQIDDISKYYYNEELIIENNKAIVEYIMKMDEDLDDYPTDLSDKIQKAYFNLK